MIKTEIRVNASFVSGVLAGIAMVESRLHGFQFGWFLASAVIYVTVNTFLKDETCA